VGAVVVTGAGGIFSGAEVEVGGEAQAPVRRTSAVTPVRKSIEWILVAASLIMAAEYTV
jgi:hypothetical protein